MDDPGLIGKLNAMKLHETKTVEFYYIPGVKTHITAVPGGWIYAYQYHDNISPVFVPRTNFMK